MECDITFEKPVLKDMEEIARLLSSPAFYDENTHQLNLRHLIFDVLRMVK